MANGNGIGHGLGYKYNVANIDPQPETRKIWQRVEELREDFPPDERERLLHYVAELELKLEKLQG